MKNLGADEKSPCIRTVISVSICNLIIMISVFWCVVTVCCYIVLLRFSLASDYLREPYERGRVAGQENDLTACLDA